MILHAFPSVKCSDIGALTLREYSQLLFFSIKLLNYENAAMAGAYPFEEESATPEDLAREWNERVRTGF